MPYADEAALEAALVKHGKNVAAVVLEPIQGEAGVVVPPDSYLRRVPKTRGRGGAAAATWIFS